MKEMMLFSDYTISPALLSELDFNRVKKDKDTGQLVLLESDGGPATRKFNLNIKAPILHTLRKTLNDTVYMPHATKRSIKTLYQPNKVPIIREHVIGSGVLEDKPAPDAIGRVQFAEYYDFNQDFRFYNLAEKNQKDVIRVVQEMMRDGIIYQDSFGGVGAVKANLRISDPDAIEKFLDERMMNFSVGGLSRDIYSPFNGKHVSELEDSDLGPFDTKEGMSGFKLVGNVRFVELSTTLTPADVLAKVESMQLEEVRIQDKEKCTYNGNRIVIQQSGFFDLKGDVEMTKPVQNEEVNVRDYCGPDNTFLVRSYEEAVKALEDLQKSDLDEKMKDSIKKAVESKKNKFVEKEKGILVNKVALKEKAEKLSSFEMVCLVENVAELAKEVVDQSVIKEMFLSTDELKLKDLHQGLSIELKDSKTKQAALEEYAKELEAKLALAQKSFVIVAKSIRDNMECKNLEDLAEGVEVSKEFEVLLKDEKLMEKLNKIYKGLSPEQPEADAETLENPVHQSREETVTLSEYEKYVTDKYNTKVAQDGISKATSWLKDLKTKTLITQDIYDSLVKEA